MASFMRQNLFKINTLAFRVKMLVVGVLIFPLCIFSPVISTAQTQLERISIAERSDSLGFVLRFHLTESVDSFAIAHIEQTKMQLALFDDNLIISKSLILPDSDVIKIEEIVGSNGNFIFEIDIYGEQYFTGDSYFDVNQKDVLLALTYTSEGLSEADTPLLNPEIKGVPKEAKAKVELSETGKDSSRAKRSQYEGDHWQDLDDVAGKSKRSLRRVFPGSSMEFYLRWVGEELRDSRKTHHLRYSGYSGSAEFLSMRYDHPWIDHPFFSENNEVIHNNIILFDPVLFTSFNSDYPVGGNDGALWQGRGFNNTFSMGAGYESKYVELSLRPIFAYSGNRDFDLSPTPPYEGLSKYAMALTNSDIPQRFGDSSVHRLDFGESFIKFKYREWAAGISNERLRTGPAIYNPLLFGYNAPGFFHTFVGTDEPQDFLNGRFNVRLFWGNLKGSDYLYPEESENSRLDTRIITGLSLNYNPDFMPSLHLGFTRTAVSYLPESGMEIDDIFMAFSRSQEKDEDMDPIDARLSKMAVYIRWHFPKSGFEAYAEWGRYDNRRLLRDILIEPELNRAYVLGFIKRFYVGTGRRIILNGEVTNLENLSVTSQSRNFNIWYTHPVIKHGFTHRGQVLGAPIGPGSSTQRIFASYYAGFGMLGFSLGRIAHHNDRFFKNLEFYRAARARPWIPTRTFQEIEMFGSIQTLFFLPGGFELQGDMRYGKIENRNNQFDVDTSTGEVERFFFDETNWNVAFTLRYNIASRKG